MREVILLKVLVSVKGTEVQVYGDIAIGERKVRICNNHERLAGKA